MVKICCSKCGKHLEAPDAAVGRQGKCPGCGDVFTIESIFEKAPVVKESAEERYKENKKGSSNRVGNDNTDMRKCPDCLADILTAAVMCRHCGSRLVSQGSKRTNGEATAALIFAIVGDTNR